MLRSIIFFSVTIGLISLLTGCASIEKKRYSNGYYFHWNSKRPAVNVTEAHRSEKAVVPVPPTDTFISTPPIQANAVLKPVPHAISGVNAVSEHISSSPHTQYPQKTIFRLPASQEDDTAVRVLAMVFLIGGLVLTAIYSWALWFVVGGLLAIIILMLNFAFGKNIIPPGRSTDKKTPAAPRRVPQSVIFAWMATLFTVFSVFFFHWAIAILSSIVGAFLSSDAIQRIRGEREKYKGIGIVIIPFILNLAVIAYVAYTLMVYGLSRI